MNAVKGLTARTVNFCGLTEENYLLSLAIGFGGAVLGAWLSYYFTRRADKLRSEKEVKDRKNGVIKSILAEQNLITETLKEEPRQLQIDPSFKLRTSPLSEGSYSGALSSGNFSLLEPELQREITEFYLYVHVTNRTLEMFLEYAFYAERVEERFTKQIESFVNDINDRHSKIVEKISNLQKSLKAHLAS